MSTLEEAKNFVAFHGFIPRKRNWGLRKHLQMRKALEFYASSYDGGAKAKEVLKGG